MTQSRTGLATPDREATNVLDSRDFTRLYLSHRRAVFGAACATAGPDLAGDVTQETFVRFWQHPERYDSTRGSIRTLLTTMARNVALDMIRTHQSQRARDSRYYRRTFRLNHENSLNDVDDAMALESDLEHLRAALDRLTPLQRQAVLCIAHTGCSYRQAARSLGIAEGTLKQRIRSSLTVLRAAMSETTVETAESARSERHSHASTQCGQVA